MKTLVASVISETTLPLSVLLHSFQIMTILYSGNFETTLYNSLYFLSPIHYPHILSVFS